MQTAVRFHVDGPVAMVTLDSPQNRNRLGPSAVAELERALADAESNRSVRVVILRATGDPFSDGMDLSSLQPTTNLPSADDRITGRAGAAVAHEAIAGYSRVLRALSGGRSPTICVLDAPVRAGGVGLVAACDIVLATERASLELSEVRFGLVPANVLPYLLRWRMSPQKARYLVLTARRLSACRSGSRGAGGRGLLVGYAGKRGASAGEGTAGIEPRRTRSGETGYRRVGRTVSNRSSREGHCASRIAGKQPGDAGGHCRLRVRGSSDLVRRLQACRSARRNPA